MCFSLTQVKAQKGVVLKVKYLPNHDYQTSLSMDMKLVASVTGDQQIIDKLNSQGITQPINANVSLAMAGDSRTGAVAADKTFPINIDYKINNISVSANGKEVPIPPKVTEKDLKLVGHVSEDWKIQIDSAEGKKVTDSTEKKMKQMMNIPATEREIMGKKGREKMIREFDKKMVIQIYLQAIEEIIHGRD